jgi:YVTN family beta-propeller protein
VTPIATATNTAGAPIPVGTTPIAIAPDRSTAYVANQAGTVTRIITATNTAGPPITVGSLPYAIAITPDGNTAYVANFNSDTVTPITTATNTAGPPIKVGENRLAIAITLVPLTPAPTGLIVSGYNNAKCVDDLGDSASNDTPAVVSDSTGNSEQQWAVQADGPIRLNGKCLDLYRQGKINRTTVELPLADRGLPARARRRSVEDPSRLVLDRRWD